MTDSLLVGNKGKVGGDMPAVFRESCTGCCCVGAVFCICIGPPV